MTTTPLSPEAIAAALALASSPPSPTDRYGEPPWSTEQAAEWEQLHGHDIRLRCFKVDYCAVVEHAHDELVGAVATLLDTTRAQAEQIATLERVNRRAADVLQLWNDDCNWVHRGHQDPCPRFRTAWDRDSSFKALFDAVWANDPTEITRSRERAQERLLDPSAGLD